MQSTLTPIIAKYNKTITDVAVNLSTSETQVVTVTGSPDGGTFVLSFDGKSTGNIAFDASAADVENALAALSNIGTGNIDVTGSDGGPYTVQFIGTLKGVDVALMTSDASGLTGGVAPDVTVSTTVVPLDFTIPDIEAADVMMLTIEGTSIRVTFDGTTPPTSSNGHLYATGYYTIEGWELIRNLKMIRATGSDSTVTITLLKRD